MKTSAINETYTKPNKIAFKGYSVNLNDQGFREHKFFTPYDSNKYDAKIELRSFIEKDGEWVPNSKITSVNLPPQGIKVSNNVLFNKHRAVGYRFVFSQKNNPHIKTYKIDNGIISNPSSTKAEDNFSILLNNRSLMPDNKLTKQVMPDLLPGYKMEYLPNNYFNTSYNKDVRKKALETIRNHGNKLGGNFAGIIKMLNHWEIEGYTKIVGTPFTKDEVSSHLYWTENPYQVSSALGTLRDFKTMQIEFFKHGMNFIADGAFVNQGLQGIMFQHILKHGDKSPFLHWFKAPGLLDGDLKLGAIPKNPKARENFKFRLVNLPYALVEKNGFVTLEKNKKYNPKRTSYIQIYDKRLARERELREHNRLIKYYNEQKTEHPYEITNHEDITQLLTFPVDKNKYTDFLESEFKKLKEHERTFKNDDFIENLLQFPYFKITTKDKGGIDLWDGNMDIAKLSFYVGNTDQKYIDKLPNKADKEATAARMNQAIKEVQDFTFRAGKYWTKVVADAQMDHIVNLFKNVPLEPKAFYNKIQEQVRYGNLPEITKDVVTYEAVENLLKGNYVSPYPKTELISENKFVELVRTHLMETDFVAYEFAPDISAVFATPYIARYTTDELEAQKTRYQEYSEELRQVKRTDKGIFNTANKEMSKYMYEYLSEFVCRTIMEIINERWYNDDPNLTHHPTTYDVYELGQYMIPLLIPDIIKYAVVKALNPDEKINVLSDTGEIVFNPQSLSKISLQTLGITGKTPEGEALALIRHLRRGTKRLIAKEEFKTLARALSNKYKDMPVEYFKMAEMITDRTRTGLGWRIDAAKDIANIDAIRTGNDNDVRLLDKLVEFWGKFNDEIKKVNRNAYTTAEITNFDEVVKETNKKYKNDVYAEEKFIEKTGLNNTANYMFFFSLLKNLFSFDAESGGDGDFNQINKLHEKLMHGWPPKCNGFLFQYPNDSIANSYTFVGNHDKPRALHIFALDMNLFHSNFDNDDHIDRAIKVLSHDKNQKIDIYTLNGSAIAMGEKLLSALETANLNDERLKKAVSQLANGRYKEHKFNSQAFGSRDFQFVIKDVFDIAEHLGYQPKDRKKEMDAVLEAILAPAMDKMESVYKMLVTLPGSPTDFVGDKEGCSGYETKCNNVFQQNRNAVPFEWVNDVLNMPEHRGDEKPFVAKYYTRMNQIGNLRNKPELSALKQGTTIALPLQNAVAVDADTNKTINTDVKVAGTFRYDENGSQVICLYTTAGAENTADNKTAMKRPRVDMDKLVLSDDESWKYGIKAGLKEGDIFINENDPCAKYEVQIENGKYILKNKTENLNISILPSDKNTAVLYKYNPDNHPPIPAYFVLPKIRHQ